VPIVVLLLPLVAAPETSSDALYYHLLVPKLWLQAGAIVNLPLFVESHYPPLAALNYTALLALHGDVAAKGLHFLLALLVAAAVARLAPRRGALAAALFLSMPVVALAGAWAWNDMFFTLFVLLALHELRDERFVSAGALFGLAAATKYTFVLAGVGILALFIRERWRPRQWLRFAQPFIAISLVWMTKNVLETGNPIYPFLFRAGEWTAAAAAHFHSMLSSEMGDWPLATYAQWPVLLTMRPRGLDIHTGLLPLLLLPLAFLAPRQQRKAFFGTYVIATFAFWLVVKTVTRSLLVSFALLFVLIALGFDTLPRNARRVVATIIALALALNLGLFLVSAYADMDPVRYFVGLEQRGAYVARTAPLQRVYFWLNHNPAVKGVLLVARHDPFYLDKKVLFSSRADTPYVQFLIQRHGTAARVVQVLRQQGITHIVVDPRRYTRENVEHIFTWNEQARAQLRELLGKHARAVARIDDAVVFELEK
jgi:4-amino-4-deoxy-L-arabinose transferase-like glycosyltransferase